SIVGPNTNSSGSEFSLVLVSKVLPISKNSSGTLISIVLVSYVVFPGVSLTAFFLISISFSEYLLYICLFMFFPLYYFYLTFFYCFISHNSNIHFTILL